MPAVLSTFVCPTCGKDFYLKGTRLRLWLVKKSKKPSVLGPYCNYACSARANVRVAIATRKSKLQEAKSRASSNLVNAVDS